MNAPTTKRSSFKQVQCWPLQRASEELALRYQVEQSKLKRTVCPQRFKRNGSTHANSSFRRFLLRRGRFRLPRLPLKPCRARHITFGTMKNSAMSLFFSRVSFMAVGFPMATMPKAGSKADPLRGPGAQFLAEQAGVGNKAIDLRFSPLQQQREKALADQRSVSGLLSQFGFVPRD